MLTSSTSETWSAWSSAGRKTTPIRPASSDRDQCEPAGPGVPPGEQRTRAATDKRPAAPAKGTRLNPDFELYDNVGRTGEQIAAYHARSATSDDLYRWAERDAQTFRAQHPLPQEPFPAPDLSPYSAALAAAETSAEFSAVLNALLDSVEPFLNEVVDQLVETAHWRDHNRGAAPGSPPRLLRDAASRIATALAMASDADLRILRAHYDPPPDLDALMKQARTAHNAPPTPPPPGPDPGPGRPRR